MARPKPKRRIEPRHLIGEVASQLQRLGFLSVSKSSNGSRYFTYPPLRFRLRISDHALPPTVASRFPGTVLSVKLDPITVDEIPLVVIEIGIRYLAAAHARQQQRSPDWIRTSNRW